MASATGIPEERPSSIQDGVENEPLLGRPGDVTQAEDQNIFINLVTGTAALAQVGILIIAGLVWSGIFTHELIFFSPHPLLNSVAVLLTVQAILIVQPTKTASQKRAGALTHFGFLAIANLAFISALIIIEINKESHPETRFSSVHGVLGLITYIIIFLQAAVGVAQYFFPEEVFGSVENGKKIYKWHRVSGYVLFVLELVVIIAATKTDYNVTTLHIGFWPVTIASALTFAGVVARVKRLTLRSPRRNFSVSRSVLSTASSRPPTAPKAVPNVRHIRENAELYSKNCLDRNYKPVADYPPRIQSLAKEAADLQHALQHPRSRIKQVEKEIAKLATLAARHKQTGQQGEGKGAGTAVPGELKSGDLDRTEALEELRSEAKELKDASQQMMDRRQDCMEEIQQLALSLPNLTSKETPIGDVPQVVTYINFDPASPPSYTSISASPSSIPRSHVSIGTELGLIDFSSSATSTGWGWYFLTNEGCLLEHALVQYALSTARSKGWKPVSPPSVVYSHIAEACGFQPRDANNEQQIWSIQQTERDRAAHKPQRSLTGTAEIPLAAMYAGQEILADQLPIKLVGASRCYRAEAGARGVDTKGLYRVHEFTKVELFAWADNIESNATTMVSNEVNSLSLFEEMLSIQTDILSSLNLPCRVLEMSSSDLGASATRKRDIEVLFPSRMPNGSDKSSVLDPDYSGWGEVTSTSICTDYQSRRLGTRVRDSAGESRFPHTVNGTAMAVPRVLAAILEHGWDEKLGGIVVPEVLRPWMGGIEVIRGNK
ncbi:putative Cytochrome b561 [Arthroderma uncinatum]|uniref:putative Cytochrome b561 n=1 Tax=Arthroderma uncinatum TaxID=74035 RepID=UPI00144ADC51|nr:putative Cytochrome b561 [Arthroderma uncinatum]KAF3491205.1 putative Cytochrome b561 [Arthroderma uncinatum]